MHKRTLPPVAALLGALSVFGADTKKPNILWISCEDMSPHLGCYGDKTVPTPNIDKLASLGIRYTQAFTTAAISAPSRSSIITGMYQTSTGCMHMRTGSYQRSFRSDGGYAAVPPAYVKAFPEYMRAGGYYCTNNSKTDYQFDSGEVPPSIWDECSKMAHYKNRKDKSRPFFAVFNFECTHESHNWKPYKKTDPAKVVVPPYYTDTRVVRENLASMYDNIIELDSIVGAMIAELQKLGEADNTIVFFWSDHGDGLPRGKRWLYDSGLNIALIVAFPDGKEAGTVNNQLVSGVDFGPTVLSLAGIPVPGHMQGNPFLGAQQREQRQYVFAARDRVDESYDMIRAVRSGKYLYIRNYYLNQVSTLYVPYLNRMPIMQEMYRLRNDNKLKGEQYAWLLSERAPEEFYDVARDPFQIHNLAADPAYSAELKNLREKLNEWRTETKDMGDITESEMLKQMWPDGVKPITMKPSYIIYSNNEKGSRQMKHDTVLAAPAMIDFFCPTQGASIVYTNSMDDNGWNLYHGPVHLVKGKNIFRLKAVRYGYKTSDEIKFVIEMK